MTSTETINPINLQKPMLAVEKADDKKREDQGSKIDPLLLAFMYIFEAVQICHTTAGIQAKESKANALAMNNLINEDGQLGFYKLHQSQLVNKHVIDHYGVKDVFGEEVVYIKSQVVKYTPAKVSGTILDQLNSKNEEISAQRSYLGDKLTVLQQNSSMEETGINSIMNEDQQDISQGSKIMQMLVSLSNQISQI